ncbi:exodeoxyribonuclease III [Kiloniella laminariae]|uniref:exodeoxyribonuclease III n=1 Tax=Kiloniella laminariae TaxID=454162 RepID=UPI0003764BB2|nr:exodeoxyribonuclease III [Kiloniella laminariae]
MIKIATWNVNSINKRLPNVLEWIREASPHVLLLQELKTVAEKFPYLEFEELGYHVEVVGQKSYNGVALISKAPITDVLRELPGDSEDDHARYVEGTTFGLRVASIYLPNGNNNYNKTDSVKFPYKLKWMERLNAHAAALLKTEQPTVLAGDFNLIPTDDDVFDPRRFDGSAHTHAASRNRYRALEHLGYNEAWRSLNNEAHVYSYWDYQKEAYQHNNGIRIDLMMLSPQAADLLMASAIDKAPRGKESPSDHTPVYCEFDIPQKAAA